MRTNLGVRIVCVFRKIDRNEFPGDIVQPERRRKILRSDVGHARALNRENAFRSCELLTVDGHSLQIDRVRRNEIVLSPLCAKAAKETLPRRDWLDGARHAV